MSDCYIKAVVAAYQACLKVPIGEVERANPKFQELMATLVCVIANHLGLTAEQVQTAFERMGPP